MAKTIKPKNNTYWDSKGIMHNRQLLSDILNINAIDMRLSSNTSFTISQTWGRATLSLNTVANVFGTKLTSNSGGVKVGAGVHHIRVNANSMVNGIGNGDMYVGVMVNNTVISQGYYRNNTSNQYGTIGLTPRIIAVNEGDMIKMFYGAGATGTLQVAGGVYTSLVVEVID